MNNYDLELNKAIAEIKKTKAKNVCIQLPDGLKPKAKEIKEAIDKIIAIKENKVNIFIWAGSCFGACDTPQSLDKLKIDLLIQWGHSEWN
ncbi:MAG: diphthamide synthesis protein [Candidatus Woesearchaeota archaeon]